MLSYLMYKLNKQMKTKNWTDFPLLINNETFTNKLIRETVNKFWNDIIVEGSNNHIILLYRIQRNNFKISTLCNLQGLNINDKELCIKNIENGATSYYGVRVNKIIISYGIRTGEYIGESMMESPITHTHYHFKLPITTKPEKFGKLLHFHANYYISQINNNNIAIIEVKDNINHVKLFKFGSLVFEFIDEIISDSNFNRYIGNTKYIFENNELMQTQIIDYNPFIYMSDMSLYDRMNKQFQINK